MTDTSRGNLRRKRLAQLGDVFVVPLENHLYGACRVLRVGDPQGVFGEGPLLAACRWIGEKIPTISEPNLRAILTETSFGSNGRAIIKWVYGPPPKDFILLGRIESVVEEQCMEVPWGSTWEHFRKFIMYEWLWEHDQQSAIARKQAEDMRARQQHIEQRKGRKP